MFNRKSIFTTVAVIITMMYCNIGLAQNLGISSAPGILPDPSAGLDVNFTTKGFLAPRMTLSEKLAISNPAEGLLVYQTNGVAGFYYYTVARGWLFTNTPSQWTTSGSNVFYNAGNIGIGSTATPSYRLSVWAAANPLYLSGVQTGTGSDSVLSIVNGLVKKRIYTPATPENAWKLTIGNSGQTSTYNSGSYLGNADLNPLRFRTSNTQRMVIDPSNGGVGIGSNPIFNSTNPEKLLVDMGGSVGSPVATTNFNAINAKGYINNYLQLNVQNKYAGALASSDIVATADDGTETNYYVDMGINSSANTSNFFGGTHDAYLYTLGEDLLIGTATSAKNLKFLTGGSGETANTRMIIDGSGAVGVGTTTTNTGKITIDAGINPPSNTILYLTGANNGVLQLNNKNTGAGNGKTTSSDLVATADNGDDESLYINIGINGASYAAGNNALLNGSGLAYFYANAKEMYIGNAGSGHPLIFFTNSGSASDIDANGAERMRILASGQICIATEDVDQDAQLTVNGAIRASSTSSSSDIRLKKNVQALNYGLKDILLLDPVTYNWIDSTKTTQTQLGLIAQEAKKIIPEIVIGDESKGMLGIDYNKLIPVLINAFNTQQQQIEDLKKADEQDRLLVELLLKESNRN